MKPEIKNLCLSSYFQIRTRNFGAAYALKLKKILTLFFNCPFC